MVIAARPVFFLECAAGRFKSNQIIPLLIFQHPIKSPVEIVSIFIGNPAGLQCEIRDALLSDIEGFVPASSHPNLGDCVKLSLHLCPNHSSEFHAILRIGN